jgi:predicted metal-binding membrane protein
MPPDIMRAPRERPDALDVAARSDRLVVGTALLLVVVASWLYLLHMAQGMSTHGSGSMAHDTWSVSAVVGLVVMWTVMMIAMMTPSAAPMITMFAAVHRRRAAHGRPAVPTAVFVLGYLVVWTAFSVLAAFAQTALHSAMLVSSAMTTTSPLLGGALFVVAGVFQWTPLKRACLATCRSPLSFVMREWREGHRGAFVMGLRHGAYCLGCCWALMLLLFVAGVMNLLWVAVIALAVLLEKIVPGGELVGRLAGIVLVAAGIYMAAVAVVA